LFEVKEMTEEDCLTELEITVDRVSLKAKGTEKFVREIYENMREWFESALDSMQLHTEPVIKGRTAVATKEEQGMLTTTADDWRAKIAEIAEVPLSLVDIVFLIKDDLIFVADWPISGEEAERRREVALLVLFANEIHKGEQQLSTKQITRVYRHLGLQYDTKSLSRELRAHQGIRKPPNSRGYELNVQGRKAAIELLQAREKELQQDG
jgi:hypothetical protein